MSDREGARRVSLLLRNYGRRVVQHQDALLHALAPGRVQPHDARAAHLAADFPELKAVLALQLQPEVAETALSEARAKPAERAALEAVGAVMAAQPELVQALAEQFSVLRSPVMQEPERFVALQLPELAQLQEAVRLLWPALAEPGLVHTLTAGHELTDLCLGLAVLHHCRGERWPREGTVLVPPLNAGDGEDFMLLLRLCAPGAGPKASAGGIGWHLGQRQRLVVIIATPKGAPATRALLAELLTGLARGGLARVLLLGAEGPPPGSARATVALPATTVAAAADGHLGAAISQGSWRGALRALTGHAPFGDAGRCMDIHSPQVHFELALLWPVVTRLARSAQRSPSEEALTRQVALGLLAAEQPAAGQRLLRALRDQSPEDPDLRALDSLMTLGDSPPAERHAWLAQVLGSGAASPLAQVMAAQPGQPLPSVRMRLATSPHEGIALSMHLGQRALAADEPAEAACHFRHAAARSEEAGLCHQRAAGLFLQAQALGELQESELARELFAQALALTQTADRPAYSCEVHAELATLARQRGAPEEEAAQLGKALALATALEDWDLAGDLSRLMAALYFARGLGREALTWAEAALAHHQRAGQEQDALLDSMVALDCLLILGCVRQARRLLTQMSATFAEPAPPLRHLLQLVTADIEQLSGRALNLPAQSQERLPAILRSRVAYQRGEATQAQRHYAAALDEAGDEPTLFKRNLRAEALVGQAALSADQRQARALLEQALAVLKDHNAGYHAARAQLALALTLHRLEEFDQAAAALREAILAAQRGGNRGQECQARLLLALLSQERGWTEVRAEQLPQAVELAAGLPALGAPGWNLLALASLCSQLQQPAPAQALLEAALADHEASEDLLGAATSHSALAAHVARPELEAHHRGEANTLALRAAGQLVARGLRETAARALRLAGEAQLALKQTAGALRALADAYQLAEESRELRAELLEALAAAWPSGAASPEAAVLRGAAQLLRGNTEELAALAHHADALLASVDRLLAGLGPSLLQSPLSAPSPPFSSP